MTGPRAKAGFTLIEALIVLAISAITLGLIFTIGARGGQTGFRLGQRALDVADSQLSADTFRSVVDSLVVPPLVTRAMSEGGVEDDSIDTAFRGEAAQVSSPWLATRASPCGVAGATGRLTLAIAKNGQRTVLTCQVDDGDQIVLIDLKWTDAHFLYSEDGITWVEAWTVEPGEPVLDAADPAGELRKVYIRVATDDGVADLIDIASSGRAIGQAGTQTGG